MNEQLENIIKMVAEMTNNEQQLFYKGLAERGFKENEIDCFRSKVVFWKMENVPGFKKMVMELVGNRVYNELRGL